MDMDEKRALELIDAHLDQQLLTDEESDELTAWIRSDSHQADAAFFRVFLHSYLRFRIQAGLPVDSRVSVPAPQLIDVEFTPAGSSRRLDSSASSKHRGWLRGKRGWGIGLLLFGTLSACVWAYRSGSSLAPPPPEPLWAYEGFDYPATVWSMDEAGEYSWPTEGGLEGLHGGYGWSEPWSETNSRVAVIVDYDHPGVPWESNDMRKFRPLEFADKQGRQLQTSGHQMRTATRPRSITVRRFDLHAFPESIRDEAGLGRDGGVVWFSFLAQSSSSSAINNHYSYLALGSKDASGLRLGKLGAAPAGNWTATGLLTGAEVNLQSSSFPSGQKVLLVTRLTFRHGTEEALIWINPSLDREPEEAQADLQLELPDFRFDGVAIHANHSTDFDEIRFGPSFASVTPCKE